MKNETHWERTAVPNLLRNKTSRMFYARLRVNGKQKWKTLNTKTLTVAKLRLADMERAIRSNSIAVRAVASGSFTVGDAMELYRQRIVTSDKRPNTKEFYLKGIKSVQRTWPALASLSINRVSRTSIEEWLRKITLNGTGFLPPGAKGSSNAGNSPSTVKTALLAIRETFKISVEHGARFDNPTDGLRSPPPRQKKLTLPTRLQFSEILESIRQAGAGGKSQAAHDLVAGLAYSGMRVGEARRLTWGHVDFEKRRLSVPGYKTASSARLVPFNSNLEALLQRMRQESSTTGQDERVFLFGEAQKALTGACQKVGATRLTHHDLRHFFATISIESGVDIPTVSRWLGHADGGALAMKTYGHLRDEHSTAAALKVSFS